MSSRPVGDRKVRWRRSQVQAFTAGALICLLSVLIIAWQAYSQGRESIRLQSVTRGTTAVITRRWKAESGGAVQYWIAYRYPELPARAPDSMMRVAHLWWAEMSPGSKLSISYNPAAPESNGLAGNKPHLFARWLWTGGLASALCILVLVAMYIADWRRKSAALWLVQEGQTAVGEITDIVETVVTRRDHPRWRYDISYQYPRPDGSLAKNNRSEVRTTPRDWEIGTLVTVFFDPRNPDHHALYGDLPGEVMSST